jgi:uncharacterized membrane protein
MRFKLNYVGVFVCFIIAILIFVGFIGLVFNYNSDIIPGLEQTALMNAEIDYDFNKLPQITDNHLECQTRASNQTFEPHPYIEVPLIEEGEIYRVTPKEAFIHFKVYNKGNGEDNFETRAQVGEFASQTKQLKKQGWNAVVHSGKITRILKPNEYQIVTVKVIVPSTVRSGSPCPIRLFATSIKDPTHWNGERNNTIYVFTDMYKSVSAIEPELNTLYMYPNSERSTIFTIRNTGNYIDKTIIVNISSIPEDWEVTIDSSDIPPGGLTRNSTADIEVTIITPERVVVSDYEVRFVLMSDDEIKDEIVLPVHVLKLRKIALKCEEARKIGNVNEIITFTINVENKGNTPEKVDFNYSFLTPGMENLSWNIAISKNSITLYPYESQEIVFAILIPHKALADTDFQTINSLEGYLIEVKGISQNDSTVTAEKDLEVVVNPMVNLSFTKSNETIYLTLNQIQAIEHSLKIKNEGNTLDLIDLYYESNYNWTWVPYENYRLLPGETKDFNIKLNPPTTLAVGQYNFTIFAKSMNDPSFIQNFELSLEIINSDLEISKVQIDAMDFSEAVVEEGETVLIRALITNLEDLDYNNKTSGKKVVIKFMEGSNYLGEVDIPYLSTQRNIENNSVWISFSWKVGKARLYTIIIKLDPYNSFLDTNIKNNEFIGKIKVEEIPEEIIDEKIDDGNEIKAPNLPTTIVIILIFLIILSIFLWLTSIKTKHTHKKK